MPKKPAALSINLLPDKETTFGEKFLNWSLTFGRYIIIGTEIIVLVAFFSRFKLDHDLIDLKDKVTQSKNVLISLKPVEDDVNLLQKRLSEIVAIESQQGNGFVALSDVANFTPQEITYKNISVSGNKVTIIGTAAQTEDISRFTSLLASANLFKKDSVALEKVERRPNETLITFTATGLVEK